MPVFKPQRYAVPRVARVHVRVAHGERELDLGVGVRVAQGAHAQDTPTGKNH